MKPLRKRRFLSLLSAAGLASVEWGRCETYLSNDQAKDILFPGQTLTTANVTLTAEQKKSIAAASGVRVRSGTVQAFRASGGGWLIIDNVLGKHEYIDFALALNADGSVKGVEILTYRETYGGQIRNAKWRAQFTGKKAGAALKLDDDIKNISGATLSCSHISEGVRRLLHTWSLALNK